MEEAFERAVAKPEKVNPDFLALINSSLEKCREQGTSLIESRNTERTAFHKTENRVDSLSKYEKLIASWLSRYGIHAEILKTEYGHLQIFAPELPDSVPELPPGYGYKGGAARAILQNSLGLKGQTPRDLDIVFLGIEEDYELSNNLAREHMPEDYSHGHGVEILEPDYFTSRDFTLNEVYFDGKNIFCTRQCLTDLLRNIVRFTEYEKQESYHGDQFYVSPKLLAKAVRMVAECKVRGAENARLAEETTQLRNVYIDDFHMSLHLDRAMQAGADVAQEYVNIMRERKFLPQEIQSASQAFEYLIGTSDFVFRSAPEEEITEEDSFLDEIEQEYSLEAHTSTVPFWKKA